MLAKIKKARQKAKQKVHDYADKVFGSSSERLAGQSTSVAINNPGAGSTPAPIDALPEPAPNSGILTTYSTSPQAAPIITSQPVITSALPSKDTLPPVSRTNDPAIVQDSVPLQDSSSASIVSSRAERSGKKTAWSGLKTLIGLLNESADAFGPLKSAVGGISRCIEIYERAAKGREDYKTLREELDTLFRELSGHLKGPTPPAMTSSLMNLAKGIEKEIGFVEGKEERRMIRRVAEAMEDADEILECYQRIQRLLERVSFNANMNTWKTMDEQATKLRLKDLSPSLAAQYGSAESIDLRRNGCIPNTRIDLLKQLKGWAEDGNSKKIYWLNGMAGTGKTTIAYTLCDQLESGVTLAASFFCSRQLPACRNANLIIPTIAYQLARFSLPFRHALSNALEQAPDVHTLTVSKQFQKLIVEPLLAVQRTIPPNLVVVIDALDECDSKNGVDQILETLLSHAPGLPMKFFVTSRPEARIQDQMQSEHNRGVPAKLALHNLEHSVVREDIRTYLKAKLASPKLALTDANLETLLDQSGVLFIYAATVVRYIEADNFSRSAKRLTQVLAASNSPQRDTSVEIDALYGDIIKAALDDKALNDSDREEMKAVLHTVLCAQEPLTISVIAGLLELDVELVQAALRPLSSVLHVSSEVNGVVTTFHKSFPDFILDKDRSGTSYCDARIHNSLLAQRCFGLIGMRTPPFNICDLESSYVFDEDVPNLKQRVETAISDKMFYACSYWGLHLVLAEPSSSLLETLLDFLSVQLLLWMEVMNLKRCISAGVGVLHQVQSWLQSNSSPDDIQELALDAWRFALDYWTSPMSRSTPHIYVSALPFWPDHRAVSKCYLPKMQGMTSITGTAVGRRKSAPLAVCTSRSPVLSVAHSYDGTRIVSGSSDGQLQIWDAQTGQMVGEPLEGHTGPVNSVGYSYDGTRIVSGSHDYTVRIWDADTGQAVGEPLEGHTRPVLSVAYSRDGTQIVSGSADKTIRIWDAHTGQMVGKPLKGHTDYVRSIAFSRGGTRVISGSDDRTVRMWDSHTGQMVGEPLRGHTNHVYSVAYSHDGTHIVSGSADKTIRIWDAHTGQMVGEPLEGHTNIVSSLAYSPDNARIISGSRDKTVRIWHARTGQTVGEPLEGHTNYVCSVTYSHDGTRIVSGSLDNTIRIWDTHAGLSMGEPLRGHTLPVLSVACSPDGVHVTSSSADSTVQIWDVHTGQTVGEPLRGHTGPVNSVAYSYDGTRIASGSSDHSVRIWDAHTGQMVGEPLEGHTGQVYSVAYSHDGTRIVSGSHDHTVRIWDADTGQAVGEPLEGHPSSVLSVAYSPDDTHIVSGSTDETIRIWDAHTGQMVGKPLQGHTDYVRSVAFSPDNARIVSGSDDRTVRMWDSHTGQMVGEPLRGHTNYVYSVTYSHDGTHIVSGSGDKTIRIWDAHISQMRYGTFGGDSLSLQAMPQIPYQGQLAPETPPASNPASSNLPAVHSRTGWSLDEDGWVLGERSRLLIWVPPDMRACLLHPQTLFVIFTHGSLALDFSNAQLGENWHHCHRSKPSLPV